MSLTTDISPSSGNLEATAVSVLLPAWNEAETLGRCLDSLLVIEDPAIEIVLCAGGTDGTFELARRYADGHPNRIVLLEQRPGEGKQVALRRCFERSRGEVIYLTDADCVVPISALRRLVAAIVTGEADAATGPADPFPEQIEDPWVRHQWATVRAVDRGRSDVSTGILGRNCAVSRDAIVAAGGFREPVAIGTDYHFAKCLLAAGRSIRFLPVPVQTRYAEQIGEYLRQQSRWMRNILVHGPRFGARAEVASVIRTIGLGTAILAWPVSWPWTRFRGIGLWLLLVGWMTRVRMRNQCALEMEAGLVPSGPFKGVLRAFSYALIDLVVWIWPLLDLTSLRRRFRW
jgi:glycosyltransferase involved in cell wall biosynthesis